MTMHRRVFVGAAALLPLAACDGLSGPKQSFKSVDITGADYGNGFAMPDLGGRMRTLADFKGKAVVVFFGYTQCPDVCPTTMAELSMVKKALGKDGERVQGIFITVDPERDTPQVLKPYMDSFDPSFIALRGTPEQTSAVAKSFKVFYAKAQGKDGAYTMDHTAGSYVFDPAGRLRLFVRYGTGPEALTADLKTLLAAA